jgi:hypothetical protein
MIEISFLIYAFLCDLRLSREADENCSLLGYYAASSGNSLPTFRNNLSVPSSSVKTVSAAVAITRIHETVGRKIRLLGPIGRTETSVRS